MDKINLNKGETINLSKMPSIDLSKGGKGLNKVIVGLGWDPVTEMNQGKKRGLFATLFGGSLLENLQDIDCDAFAVLLQNNKMRKNSDLIYYGNLKSNDKSVYHTGDNLTGGGDGDDEQIVVDLSRVSCDKIVIGVNIYHGYQRNQHFGMLQNAFIRIVDMETNKELCRFNLDSKYDGKVSIIFGELVKTGSEWSFVAKGEASDGGSIADVIEPYQF